MSYHLKDECWPLASLETTVGAHLATPPIRQPWIWRLGLGLRLRLELGLGAQAGVWGWRLDLRLEQEILSHATWVNLEDIILEEASHKMTKSV